MRKTLTNFLLRDGIGRKIPSLIFLLASLIILVVLTLCGICNTPPQC